MAGIEHPNVVDLVGQAADGCFLLIMVESRAWGTDDNQPTQLKNKINAYVGFVADGSLAQRYPETAGQRIDIQLDCVAAPTGEIATIVDHATQQLERIGIGFRVNVAGSPHRGKA